MSEATRPSSASPISRRISSAGCELSSTVEKSNARRRFRADARSAPSVLFRFDAKRASSARSSFFGPSAPLKPSRPTSTLATYDSNVARRYASSRSSDSISTSDSRSLPLSKSSDAASAPRRSHHRASGSFHRMSRRASDAENSIGYTFSTAESDGALKREALSFEKITSADASSAGDGSGSETVASVAASRRKSRRGVVVGGRISEESSVVSQMAAAVLAASCASSCAAGLNFT